MDPLQPFIRDAEPPQLPQPGDRPLDDQASGAQPTAVRRSPPGEQRSDPPAAATGSDSARSRTGTVLLDDRMARPGPAAVPAHRGNAVNRGEQLGGASAGLIAVAAHEEGRRAVLGIDVVTGEDRAAWLASLRSLVARGLCGVELVISAAPRTDTGHCRRAAGSQLVPLPDALHAQSPGLVPKSAQAMVATLVRSILA
jgi:hypothetical protein